jgi:rubrerythrin
MAHETTPPPAATRGVDMRTAFEAAFSPSPGARQASRFEEAVERAVGTMLDRLVTEIEQRPPASAEDPRTLNPDRLLQVALTAKLVKDLTREGDGKAEVDGGLARVMEAVTRAVADTQKAVLEIQGRMQENQMRFQQDFTQTVMNLLDTIRQEARRPSEIDEIARQKLLQDLQSNPIQSYLAMREEIKKELEQERAHREQENVIDFDHYLRARELRLREKEIDQKLAAEERRQERFAQLMSDLAAVATGQPALAGAAAPPAGPVGPPGPAPETLGLVRVACAACGQAFALPQAPAVGTVLTCPFCAHQIRVEQVGPAAPPPTASPPPPAAAPPASPAGLADTLMGEY